MSKTHKSNKTAAVTVTVVAPIGTRTLTVVRYWITYWRSLGYQVTEH